VAPVKPLDLRGRQDVHSHRLVLLAGHLKGVQEGGLGGVGGAWGGRAGGGGGGGGGGGDWGLAVMVHDGERITSIVVVIIIGINSIIIGGIIIIIIGIIIIIIGIIIIIITIIIITIASS
jgi:hypothetical protein